METEKCKVTFLPSKKTFMVKQGADLLSSAIASGEYINSSCGGDGICGRCKVLIKKGDYRTEPTGRISHIDKEKGYVLACLTTVQGDLVVHIPKESRLQLDKIKEEDAKFLRLKGMYSTAENVSEGKPIIDEKVFTHSPLATKVTEVFRKNIHYMSQAVKDQIKKDSSPFDFLNLHYVQNQSESKALNNDKRPMIIIAGSYHS